MSCDIWIKRAKVRFFFDICKGSKGKKVGKRCYFIPLLFLASYLWTIRRIFVGYSWDIHMYRLCVGYVSVICRSKWGANGGKNKVGKVKNSKENSAVVKYCKQILSKLSVDIVNFVGRYCLNCKPILSKLLVDIA